MSHIFISYAHADKPHLDKLITWLRENGTADHELWYDQHMESGDNWRDEITSALDEAFAVLVIVTKNSAKSLYCTYEWAYAMGQGIPILPMVFDEVSVADTPVPLTSKQFTNCTDHIPGYLIEQIRQLKSVPPQVAAINKVIYDAIYDTHRRFFILRWVGDGLLALDPEFARSVLEYFMKRASEAHQVLLGLMVDKAFVFTGKQYRFCWKMIDLLQKFSRLQPEHNKYLPDHFYAQFDDSWLPAFEYFEPKKWWGRWIRSHFEGDLEDNRAKMEVLAEIMRAFPIFLVDDAEILIQNKIIDQKRKL